MFIAAKRVNSGQGTQFPAGDIAPCSKLPFERWAMESMACVFNNLTHLTVFNNLYMLDGACNCLQDMLGAGHSLTVSKEKQNHGAFCSADQINQSTECWTESVNQGAIRWAGCMNQRAMRWSEHIN